MTLKSVVEQWRKDPSSVRRPVDRHPYLRMMMSEHAAVFVAHSYEWLLRFVRREDRPRIEAHLGNLLHEYVKRSVTDGIEPALQWAGKLTAPRALKIDRSEMDDVFMLAVEKALRDEVQKAWKSWRSPADMQKTLRPIVNRVFQLYGYPSSQEQWPICTSRQQFIKTVLAKERGWSASKRSQARRRQQLRAPAELDSRIRSHQILLQGGDALMAQWGWTRPELEKWLKYLKQERAKLRSS